MKKNGLFRWLLSGIALMSSSALFASPIEYTQLTSLQNQPATNATNLASLETVDGIQNIGSALNKVTVKNSGFYFVIASGQAGAVKNASANGSVDLWLVRNNTPIPNSGSRISLFPQSTAMVMCQNIVQLNAGDSISVGFSASEAAYGLVAAPASSGKPAVTSLTFTIYRLN